MTGKSADRGRAMRLFRCAAQSAATLDVRRAMGWARKGEKTAPEQQSAAGRDIPRSRLVWIQPSPPDSAISLHPGHDSSDGAGRNPQIVAHSAWLVPPVRSPRSRASTFSPPNGSGKMPHRWLWQGHNFVAGEGLRVSLGARARKVL